MTKQITAKFFGKCASCSGNIQKGQLCVHDQENKKVYHTHCAQKLGLLSDGKDAGSIRQTSSKPQTTSASAAFVGTPANTKEMIDMIDRNILALTDLKASIIRNMGVK